MPKALQLNVLAEFMRNLHPHVDDLWGPERPNVRVIDRLGPVALNPQPLPPLLPRIHNVAAMVITSMLHTVRHLEYQNEKDQQITVRRMTQQLDDLAGWCGTVPVSERIRALLKKLGIPIPPIPDPEPHPDWTSVIASAALFADAASMMTQPALAEAFNNAADKTLEAGLTMGGFAK
jgi:hypothetical protein